MKKIYKYKKAFSLIELLLTLGIISALMILAFIVYPKVDSTQKSDREIKNISTIIAGAKSVYRSFADYSGLNNEVLINANVLPDNMLSEDKTSIINSFGGLVTVSSANYSGLANASISITYNNVPSDICSKITAGMFKQAASVRVNNIAFASMSQLVTKCSATATSNLIMTFL